MLPLSNRCLVRSHRCTIVPMMPNERRRDNTRAVVGHLDPSTFRAFKVYTIEHGLTVDSAVCSAVKWLMKDLRTLPPNPDEDMDNGT